MNSFFLIKINGAQSCTDKLILYSNNKQPFTQKTPFEKTTAFLINILTTIPLLFLEKIH